MRKTLTISHDHWSNERYKQLKKMVQCRENCLIYGTTNILFAKIRSCTLIKHVITGRRVFVPRISHPIPNYEKSHARSTCSHERSGPVSVVGCESTQTSTARSVCARGIMAGERLSRGRMSHEGDWPGFFTATCSDAVFS